LKNSNFKKIEVVVFAIILIGTLIIVPSTAVKIKVKPNTVTVWENKTTENTFDEPDNNKIPVFSPTTHPDKPIAPDTYYVPEQEVFAGEQNDVGYNTDAGGNILKSLPLYVGEPVDETVPGRGRTGTLDPSDRDSEDWYKFSVCEGQTIQVSLTGSGDFELKDPEANPISNGYTATETGIYFLRVYTEGSGGDYTISVTLDGQNDAGKDRDAGNTINQADQQKVNQANHIHTHLQQLILKVMIYTTSSTGAMEQIVDG